MPLSDALRGFDLNTKINPNNSRGPFQLGKSTDTDTALEAYYDAVWDGNKLDKAAIETWAAGEPVYYTSFYDQWGTKDLVLSSLYSGTAVQCYDGTNFVNEDENGNLYTHFPSSAQTFRNDDYSDLGNFSLLFRVQSDIGIDTSRTLIGIGANNGYLFRTETNDDPHFSNFGDNLTSFVDDVPVYTKNELYTNLNDGEWHILSVMNADYPTPNPDSFRLGYGAYDGAGETTRRFSTLLFFDGDITADQADLKSEIESLYNPPSTGIITYGDGPNMGDPVEGANVVYLQIDDDSFANAIVLQQVVTGANGRHTLTETVPAGKLVAFMSHKKETDGTYFSTPPKIPNRYLPE